MSGLPTGKPVEELQKMLRTIAKADRKSPMPLPNGVFDAETEAALKHFQRTHALPVTGAADLDTWNAVRAAYRALAPLVLPLPPLELRWEPLQIISPGSSNAHLYLIQAMLHVLGDSYANLPPVEVTGTHDEKSVAAVRKLHQLAGMPDNSVIDQRTWQILSCLYRMTVGRGCPEEQLEKQSIAAE